jgi:hypothetical protein
MATAAVIFRAGLFTTDTKALRTATDLGTTEYTEKHGRICKKFFRVFSVFRG